MGITIFLFLLLIFSPKLEKIENKMHFTINEQITKALLTLIFFLAFPLATLGVGLRPVLLVSLQGSDRPGSSSVVALPDPSSPKQLNLRGTWPPP